MTKGKGRKIHSNQVAGTSKRGRKTNQQTLESLAKSYETRILMDIQKTIQGWERDSDDEEDEIQSQQEGIHFLSDPGNTRGRVSLFQQSVKTYWKIKCVLAKALSSMQEKKINSSLLFELQQIKQDMREITNAQI